MGSLVANGIFIIQFFLNGLALDGVGALTSSSDFSLNFDISPSCRLRPRSEAGEF